MSRISFIFFVRYQVSERAIMDIKSFQYNNITEIDKQKVALFYLGGYKYRRYSSPRNECHVILRYRKE